MGSWLHPGLEAEGLRSHTKEVLTAALHPAHGSAAGPVAMEPGKWQKINMQTGVAY